MIEVDSHPPTRLSRPRYRAISLFSGAGGLDSGLGMAGFDFNCFVEFDKASVQTLRLNHPSIPVIDRDIRTVSTEEIIALADVAPGELDLLCGGPPCQPFSKSIGHRPGFDDPRGTLFMEFVRIVDQARPTVFLMENVRGLMSANGGSAFRIVIEEFERLGYQVAWQLLDAADFGVPQFRQRMIIVGFRHGHTFTFPAPTHADLERPEDSRVNGNYNKKGTLRAQRSLFDDEASQLKPYVTVWNAIGDLDGEGGPDEQYKSRYQELLADIPAGMNYSFYTAERGHPSPIFQWRSKFWYFLLKIDPSRPSLTIQANPGNNTGPFHWRNRRLSIAELKRLQTFPDDYQFVGGYFAQHKQIGNAVPPLLAYRLGECIAAQIGSCVEHETEEDEVREAVLASD